MALIYYLESLDNSFSLTLEPQFSLKIGRHPDCEILLTDPSVSRFHGELFYQDEGFRLRDLKSTNGTFVNGNRIQECHLNSQDQIRFGKRELIFKVKEREGSQESTLTPEDTHILEGKIQDLIEEINDPGAIEKLQEIRRVFEKRKKDLLDIAYRDGLTTLFNRRYFDKTLKEETNRALRYGRELSVIMADIDHFKRFNDTYGHQKGDSVLRTVGAIFRDYSRTSDHVCRYGGEELVIILPETNPAEAAQSAEKLRVHLERLSQELEGVTITASFGVGSLDKGIKSPEDIVNRADAALYNAKKAGRNQVKTYGVQ